MDKSKKTTFLLLCSNLLFGIFFSWSTTSCIKNADDEELHGPDQSDTIVVDTTKVIADSAFKATLTFIVGEWMSDYVGFDPMQNANSAIRRLVFFSSDGFYDSHVQGINNIQEDSVGIYREFEHEHGTYSFDEEKQLMVYHVEYDSLLNFFTDNLEYYPGKIVQGVGIQKEYNEAISFSFEKEGKRDWIRIDDNLRSTDNHSNKLIYIMKSHQ